MPKIFISLKEIKSNILLKLVLGMIIFSVYFMFNSTVILSIDIYGNPYRYGIMHLVWIAVGFLFMNFFYHLEISKLKKFTFIIYFISAVFLFLLSLAKFFPCDNSLSFAPCTKGAVRWFVLNPKPLPDIPFIGTITFQPSELAKLSFVLLLAYLFSSIKYDINEKFKKAAIFCLPIILFVFFQPNKSTAMILFFIFCSIYYANGENLKKIYFLIAGFVAMFIFFVIFNSYSFSRLSTYLDSNVNESENYHQKQVMISLGSGGVTGLGLGKSRQKFSFLPEINSDSIFAIVGEETGFIGSTILSFVFFSIVFQGFKIALHQKEKYNKFLAVGISSWLGIQTLINLFSMADLIPLTGIPLPIISYGGSSTIFVMIALGILLNLSKSVYEKRY